MKLEITRTLGAAAGIAVVALAMMAWAVMAMMGILARHGSVSRRIFWVAS